MLLSRLPHPHGKVLLIDPWRSNLSNPEANDGKESIDRSIYADLRRLSTGRAATNLL
jgi:hypothetical protein